MTADGRRLGRNYHRLFGAATISNLGDGVALVAYPWLASAVTRNPLLIAIVVVVQRLPWLLFALPAGVLTDRHDRRLLMIISNSARAVITVFVAVAVIFRGDDLPGPDEFDSVVSTDVVLYITILVATFLLGIGEMLYDNCAQTLMPSLVRSTSTGEGQRTTVGGPGGRQPLRRPTARFAAAGRRLRPPVPRRRRFVRRLGSPDHDDRR